MSRPSNMDSDTHRPILARRGIQWVVVVVVSALVGSGATLVSGGAFRKIPSPVGTSPATALSSSQPVTITDSITRVVKQVEPDVVAVVNYADVSRAATPSNSIQEQGVGTGVYFSHDAQSAFIVTNNHVVAGAGKIAVVVKSGEHLTASLVGTDPYTDLAVIKIPIGGLQGTPPVTFANSDTIQVGEPTIVIGTPMGLNFVDSVTTGIVSGQQRMMPVEDPKNPQQIFDYQPVIQTDAAINPGNSGGPLINIHGFVIGINSSKIAAPNFEGMGFAIPSNVVRKIADEIIRTGHAIHPALGISGQSLATVLQSYPVQVPVDYGVYVMGVQSRQTQIAGLQAKDVIVAVNGTKVQGLAELRTVLFQALPEQVVTLEVYQGNQRRTLRVPLGTMPAAQKANLSDA